MTSKAINNEGIDFSDSNTFPLKLLQIVSNFYDINTEIKRTFLKASNNFIYDDFFNSNYSIFENVLEEIGSELANKKFFLYHATMVDNVNTILQTGLKCFNEDEYIKYVESILKSMGIWFFKRKKALKRLKEEYERKYIFSKQSLCFFSTYMDDETFYIEYCKNIGGELALFAFQNDFPDILAVLQCGEPIIVKFEFDYASFSESTKEYICKQLFKWASAKQFNLNEYIIEFDDHTEKSIMPESIIDIIPIKREIVYA